MICSNMYNKLILKNFMMYKSMSLTELPNESLLKIIIYLPYKDLLRFCQVNTQMYQIYQDDYLWRLRLDNEYPDVPRPQNTSFRRLYEYWRNRKHGKAKVIEVPKDIYNPSDLEELQNHGLIWEFMNSDPSLNDYLRKQNARRGDVIHLEVEGDYRNNGKSMYDGNEIVPLYYEIDDYGSVPPQFKVIDEFPIRYWHTENLDIIDHNTIVFFDAKSYIDQIMTNLKLIKENRYGVVYKTHFIHWTGVTYYIIMIDNGHMIDEVKDGVFNSYDDTCMLSDNEETYDPNRTIFMGY